MKWRQKAAIQRVLSFLPWGGEVNFLLQRLARGSLKLDDASFLFPARLAVHHLDTSLEYLKRPAASLAAYEFGAGSSLIAPLVRRARGIAVQIVTDQDVLLRPNLVRDAIGKVAKHGPSLSLSLSLYLISASALAVR